MKNSKLKYIILVFVTLCSFFQGFTQDLPSEFDQIINDNPEDAPIDFSVGRVLIVVAIISFMIFSKRKTTVEK